MAPNDNARSARGSAAARRKLRADRDGDVKMDAGAKGRGKIGKVSTGTSAARGGKGAKGGILSTGAQRAILRKAANGDVSMKETRAPRGELVDVTIDGWTKSKASSNPDGGLKALTQWLAKKGGFRLGRKDNKIKKFRLEGETIIISVPSTDAWAYEKMNGYDWAGAKVSIARVGGAGAQQEAGKLSSGAEETKAMLRGVLERRWNPDTRLLDLSALGADPELTATSIFGSSSTTGKFFPAMMRVLELSFSSHKERDEAIQSVSLANNELEDLKLVSTLSEFLPNLLNLDLSNNKFPNVSALGLWRRRFKKLQHLVVSGNPLEQNEPNFATELIKSYENLRMLNGVQVRTEEDIKNKNNITNIPFPIRSPHFSDEGGIAENFIRTWFAGYDNDRATLAQMYYDEDSQFSFALNTHAPRDPTSTETVEKQEWERYIGGSRNLKKISHLGVRESRNARGTKAVAEIFASLPATKHPDLATEGSKWMIEAHIQPGLPDPVNNSPGGVDGFFISVHGEFREDDTGKKRSCDHAIYIGAGGPTGVRVVSHTVTIRAYGGTQAFQAVTNTPPLPAADATNADGLPQLPGGLTIEVAEQMVTELTKQTGMTLQFSHDCLAQSNWNFEAALNTYQSAKASLPPTAYINGMPLA